MPNHYHYIFKTPRLVTSYAIRLVSSPASNYPWLPKTEHSKHSHNCSKQPCQQASLREYCSFTGAGLLPPVPVVVGVVIGFGPVFPADVGFGVVVAPPTTVTPFPTLGSTHVQVGVAVQVNGPSLDVHVVVWPVHVADAGQ
jgi:hypothetical protein